MGNKITDHTVTEKQLPKAYGLPILKNLAIEVTNEHFCNSNYPKFYVPTLNEKIIKNKNIHIYCKRNDKPWLDIQNVVLQAKAPVVDIANLFLEADKKNVVIHLRDVAVEVIDVITLLGNVNHQVTFRTKKKKLKNALSEDHKTICEQYMDCLADSVKIKTKATHSVNY